MPLNVVSSAGSVHDSLKQTSIDTSEFESTATSRIKRAKIEANHALLEEIRFINQQLIDTSVDVTDEDIDSISSTTDGEGTVVKFTYLAISLSPTLKSQFAASRVSPILPLLLFIPPSYPCCSPVLLDKISVEMSNESEDLSVKVKSLFSSSLRGLSSPMCLKEMARSWDVCVRTVVSEFAQLSGGGTFSSKYGTWKNIAKV